MLRALNDSLRVLELEKHYAMLVAHCDITHVNVNVNVNVNWMSLEDGRMVKNNPPLPGLGPVTESRSNATRSAEADQCLRSAKSCTKKEEHLN